MKLLVAACDAQSAGMKDLIARINKLSRKKREQGLTPQEEKEQQELRAMYLKNIRHQIVDALESAGYKPKKKQEQTCSCGHCSPRTEKRDEVPCPGKNIH